jgi:hypothetical protein
VRFRRVELPLSKEVMLDIRANVWSMRRGRAMFYRISGLLSGFVSLVKEIEEICSWKNSVTTIFGYFIFLFNGIWRYRIRQRREGAVSYLSFILDSWTAKNYKLIAKDFIEVVKVHVI